MGNEPHVDRITPGLRDPMDSLARADEIMHRDCREKIAALETELAAWREVGEKLEWSLYGVRDRGVVRICPCCGGMEDNHIEVCKLAALLGRK